MIDIDIVEYVNTVKMVDLNLSDMWTLKAKAAFTVLLIRCNYLLKRILKNPRM